MKKLFKWENLVKKIGQEKASELIKIVKEKIIETRTKDSEEIKKIIIEIAGELDIKLSVEDIQKIIKLMEK